MEKKKVSVIVPIYNVEKKLSRCINSILNQSYNNMEIILVNDSSPDGSEKICLQYVKNESERVKYYKKNNEGLGLTRNYGMERATGDYILFVDSDDYIESNMIEQLVDIAEAYSVNIVTSNFIYNGITQKSCLTEGIYEEEEITSNIVVKMVGNSSYKLNDQFNVSSCTKLYSREFLKKNNIKFLSEREYIWEDMAFNICAFSKAKRIFVTENSYYHYNYNEDSLTHCYDGLRFRKIMKMYRYLSCELNKQGILEQCTLRLLYNFLGNVRATFKIEVFYNNRKLAKSNIRKMLRDDTLQELVDLCDPHSLSLSQKICNLAIKRKSAFMVYLLCFVQNKINKGIIN